MDFNKLETKINEAINVRENGELGKSRLLFETILRDIEKQLRKDSSRELKKIYATAMGEHIIQLRHEAKNLYYSALDMGIKLLAFDNKNKLENPLSIRSVSNTLINLGNFEEAETYLQRLLPLYSDNSARLGDIKSHLAYCLFRQGKVDKGTILIDEAINDIKKNTAQEKFVSVWYSRALMFKAWMRIAKNDYNEAKKLTSKSLGIARKNKLSIRTRQAKEIASFLNSRKNKL